MYLFIHIQQVNNNPSISTREISTNLNLPQSTVWRTLKNANYKPYKIHVSQRLHVGDDNRRLNFCNWLQERINEDRNFLNKIIWTDESYFSNSGMFNRNNEHFWSIVNPRQNREIRNQHRFGFNVWVGLWNNQIIGPYIYEGTLNGIRYLQFLSGQMLDYLDGIPLNQLQDLWWQQDGAPPHNAVRVREFLNETFPNKWIGNRGVVEWPARSPDLSPLDYFLWGTIKNVIYKQQFQNVDELRNNLLAAFERIPRRNIERAINNMRKRARLCIQQNGLLFEHLL